jgi:hypothetical protein
MSDMNFRAEGTTMKESDFVGLPEQTRQFALKLFELGISRTKIHGLFVMLGLHAGTPRPLEEIEILFRNLDPVVPIDRSQNLDEIVGDFYDGYDREINELCFRSGKEFDFRQIHVPPVEKRFSIVYLKNEEVLDTNIISIDNLSDSLKLFDAFLTAIGSYTENRGRSLIDAFSCGVFQIQLHAQIDSKGAQQISNFLSVYRPIFYGKCLNTLLANQLEYFLGLEQGQIALIPLISSLNIKSAEQMWGFQSRLFFNKDGSPIDQIEKLDIHHWHSWVIKNTFDFHADHKNQIIPFSLSKALVKNPPLWDAIVSNIEYCNDYIRNNWGHDYNNIQSNVENMEYRAIMMYVIYLSFIDSI